MPEPHHPVCQALLRFGRWRAGNAPDSATQTLTGQAGIANRDMVAKQNFQHGLTRECLQVPPFKRHGGNHRPTLGEGPERASVKVPTAAWSVQSKDTGVTDT